MTAPSPAGRPRRARVARIALAAILALTAVAAALTPPPLAQAQSSGDRAGTQSGGDGSGEGGAKITLVSQTPWVPPTGALVLRFTTTDIPATARIDVQVHPRVNGRSRFDDSTRGDGLQAPLAGGPAPFELAAALQPDGSIQLSIPVTRAAPVPSGGVRLNNPGVYPVTITASEGGRELAQLVTSLVRIPTTDTTGPPLAVGVVVPVDGHLELADPAPDATTLAQGDDATTPESALRLVDEPAARAAIATVAGAPTVPLTVDAVPAVLEALTAGGTTSGTTGGATTASPLSGLGASLPTRQVLANPYVRIDTGAWVAAGLTADLEEQVRTGAAVLTDALGIEPDGRTAVLERTSTAAAVSYLHGLGVEKVAVPSDQLDLPAANSTFLQGFEMDDGGATALQGIVSDVGLAERLVDTGEPVLDAHRTIAELTLLYGEQPETDRGVALVVPPDASAASLSLLLSALATPATGDGRAVVEPVTLDELFRGTPTATVNERGRQTTQRLTYRSPDPGSLGSYPATLGATQRQVEGFRSMAAPSPERVGPFDQAVLASGAVDLAPAARSAMLGWTVQSIDDSASEVVALPQDYVTLTSQSGEIPLNLENRLPYAVRVRVQLRSAKLDFPEGSVMDVDLPAAEPTPLTVQVNTRASGAFPIDVQVQSPDEHLQLSSTRVTVRSTAISGVGMVLSVGAGAFLLLWWGRHFRKTRRARQLVSSDHPSLVATAAGSGSLPADDPGSPDPTDPAGPVPPPGSADPRGYAPPDTTDPGGPRWP